MNIEFEDEIKLLMEQAIKSINMDLSLTIRRLHFQYDLVAPGHNRISQDHHKSILESEITWSTFDGYVFLYYKQYGYVETQSVKFIIPEIKILLN